MVGPGLRPEDIEVAIRSIEESRETHVAWIGHDANACEHCRTNPQGAVGDDDHHRRCIAKYDQVLGVLHAVATAMREQPCPGLNATHADRRLKCVRCLIAVEVEADDTPALVWDELRTGGRLEDWLKDFDDALAALRVQEGAPRG